MRDRSPYEHKTVNALRGTDRMVIAKWENRGWELTDRTPGNMRTGLTFRRSKRRVARQAVAIAALAVLCAGAITIGVLTEDDDRGNGAATSSTPSSSTEDETAHIADFIAAFRRGDLQDYAESHHAAPMEFDAQVIGSSPGGLKSAEFIHMRAVIDGRTEGPLLQLVWGAFSRIPFPDDLRRGEIVQVRANIDRYFSDEEVWLSPDDDDSFIRASK